MPKGCVAGTRRRTVGRTCASRWMRGSRKRANTIKCSPGIAQPGKPGVAKVWRPCRKSRVLIAAELATSQSARQIWLSPFSKPPERGSTQSRALGNRAQGRLRPYAEPQAKEAKVMPVRLPEIIYLLSTARGNPASQSSGGPVVRANPVCSRPRKARTLDAPDCSTFSPRTRFVGPRAEKRDEPVRPPGIFASAKL